MLTVKQIEAARYGVSPVRLSDGNGLYVRLNKGGGKTFQLRLTKGTRTRWITLGRYPNQTRQTTWQCQRMASVAGRCLDLV